MSTTRTLGNYLKANVQKVAIQSRPAGPRKNLTPIPAKTSYRMKVEAATHKVYSTGSRGVNVKFRLTGKGVDGRILGENFIMFNKAGEENPTGIERFINFLITLGLTPEEAAGFQLPEDVNDSGDLGKLTAREVKGYVVEDGEWQGQPRRKIARYYPVGA